MAFSSNAHATGRDLSFPHLFTIKLVTNYREAWDRCCFYYADEKERAIQWGRLLQLIDAGAEEDADEYRQLAAQFTGMLIPPWNGVNSRLSEVTAAVKYQTLWTDANWTDEIKLKYIMESELPEDFCLSIYYAESREMLIQDSARKAKTKMKVKKVETGCPAEEFRVKRLLDPAVDPTKLNHARLVTLVDKMDAQISSQQQELNNYEQLKNVNKATANQWHTDLEKAKLDIKENREALFTLRETNLA